MTLPPRQRTLPATYTAGTWRMIRPLNHELFRDALRIGAVVAVLLLAPLVAMRFTDAVRWGPGDFLVAGAMLFGAGAVWARRPRHRRGPIYGAALALALLTALGLAWANLAVGVIGRADDPANLMYPGVLAVAAIGAVRARLAPQGMVTAMLATTLATALVALVALALGLDAPLRIVAIHGAFVLLWLGAAGLFLLAARRPRPGRGRAA